MNKCVKVLLCAYAFYFAFIVPLDGIYYYSASAAINLIVGLSISSVNAKAAICSYSLVILNLFGFALWYKYYPPTLYDSISIVILIMQLLFILPKGLARGFRDSINDFVASCGLSDCGGRNIKLHKSKKNKKADA